MLFPGSEIKLLFSRFRSLAILAPFQVLVCMVLDSNCYISTVLFFLPPKFSTFCVSLYESVYKTKCGISLNLFYLSPVQKPEIP